MPSHAIILEAAQYERIKKSIEEPEITDFDSSRLMKKKLCQERVKTWSNTLANAREKKMLWKKEKEEKLELERQEVDKKEAEIQQVKRFEALKRAHTLINDQTDLMKNFRSQLLYSQVMQYRKSQLGVKGERAAVEAKRDAIYHKIAMDELEQAKIAEIEKAAARKNYEKKIASWQDSQRIENEKKRQAEREAEVLEGKEILEQCKREIAEDKAKVEARKQVCKDAEMEMQRANEKLAELKLVWAEEEAKEDEAIKACVLKKESDARARKKFLQDQFEAKQATRKKMIERACAELAKFKSNEDTRLESQAAEARAREDAELARREEVRRQQREAIAESRINQRRIREAKAAWEKEANEKQMRIWDKRKQEYEQELREGAENKYRKCMEIRKYLEGQIKVFKQRKEDDLYLRSLGETHGDQLKAEERDYFEKYAAKEIQKAKAEGRPTIMLERALHMKLEPLLPGKRTKPQRKVVTDS